MLSCPLKLPAYRLPICSMPTRILPHFTYVIEHVVYPTAGVSIENKIPPHVSLVLFNSFARQCSRRVMHKDIHPEGSLPPHDEKSCKGEMQPDPSTELSLTENWQSEVDQEIKRRKRPDHGNKGRVPWNKGRKHAEETRARIRQRTKEALKDPKVRKKMSEAPRVLSDQTKVKIRTSLTKLWEKRLKWKRTREKFFQSWTESIAYAAKVGGPDQQELEWDSYNKLKREIARQQIHKVVEKAKAKEAARAQAERAAQLKAERMAVIAQKRREREENARIRGELVRKRKIKSKEEKEKLAEFQEVKLKERLMKIHRKKSTINRVSNRHQRPWEKFDLDFVKREESRKEIPLADQIRFAKNKGAKELLDKL